MLVVGTISRHKEELQFNTELVGSVRLANRQSNNSNNKNCVTSSHGAFKVCS